MSELIAEARVLVTPDTTAFRSLLTTQINAASAGVAVTIPVTPVVAAGAAAGQAAATASKEAAAAEAAITKVAQAETILASADAKIVTASTQAAAARSQFTAATRAGLVAQQAYTKALASEDDDAIAAAAATRTLAREKQNLALQTLRAAQATAAEGASQSRTAATTELAGAAAAQQAATTKVSASAAAAARANAQLARSAELVALAEKRAAASTTEVSAAQIRYQASITATAQTFKAYNTSLESSDFLLVKQARDAFAAAKANEALALSNLNVARTGKAEAAGLAEASAVQSARLGQLSKGAGSAGAALAGLRGATLAAGAPFIAGAAAAILFGKAIGIATSFNQELSVFKVTVGATADEMARVSAAAQQLGKDITLPGVSAGDAAEAMTEFAKAGLSVNDAIDATRGGLQLATAAQLSNADAVELTANALNAFKLAGNEAVDVADTLANAANAAQGSISDIGLGLKQAAGAAAVVGVSFKDTTALLTLLAKNGLTASDAGTALRTAFVRLVNPSVKAREILKSLNINLRDAQGNLRPEVFREFADAQKDLAVSAQQANSAVVFGQDAFRVIGILGRENADALDKTRVALDKQGTASKLAQARMVGLAGATANLGNQLEALGLTIGQIASGPLTNLTKGLGDMVGFLNSGASAATNFFESFGSFDAANADLGDLTAQLDKLGKDQAKFVATGGFVSPQMTADAKALQVQIAAIGKSITDSPDGLRKFVSAFTDASPQIKTAIADGVITPLENAQLATSALGRAFLAGLPKTAFTGLGAAVRSGIEDATARAKVGVADLGAEVHSGIEDAARGAVTAASEFEKVGPAIQKALKIASQAARSGLDLAVAQAGGNQNQELSILRGQQARQQAFLDAVLKRPQTKKNVALATEAAKNLENTRNAIQSILDQRAADAKQIADAAKSAAAAKQSASDQAFLNAQEDARDRQQRLINQAGDISGLADDIRRQEGLRSLIQKQINALKASAVDEKTKAAAIRTLKKARDATTDEIKSLVTADKAQRAESLQQAQEERAQAQIALGQSILDLTGNKDPLLRALAAEVKHQTAVRNAAKKGSLAFIQAQTQINELLKQRKDLLEEVDKSTTGGTSLADLFKENQDIFAQAGNVGQNAANLTSRAQNAPIRTIVQHQIDIRNDPAAARAARQEQSTDRLIAAIDRLSDTLSGNGTTGGRAAGQNQNVWRGLTQEQRFFYQRTARQLVEQGLTG